MDKTTPVEELNRLFGAARAGSQQALERLLTALQPRVYRRARRTTAGCPQVIGPSSLTQEVLLALSRLITRVRGTRNVTLYRLVNRLIQSKNASAFRRETALKRDGGWRESWDENGDLGQEQAANSYVHIEHAQRDHRLLVAIAKLPKRQRIAIEGILLGQSISDIAVQLDCKPPDVSNLLQRAKRNLDSSDDAARSDAFDDALCAYLQNSRQGSQLDACAFAAQYPGQEESLLTFLSWLHRLQKAWQGAAE